MLKLQPLELAAVKYSHRKALERVLEGPLKQVERAELAGASLYLLLAEGVLVLCRVYETAAGAEVVVELELPAHDAAVDAARKVFRTMSRFIGR